MGFNSLVKDHHRPYASLVVSRSEGKANYADSIINKFTLDVGINLTHQKQVRARPSYPLSSNRNVVAHPHPTHLNDTRHRRSCYILNLLPPNSG